MLTGSDSGMKMLGLGMGMGGEPVGGMNLFSLTGPMNAMLSWFAKQEDMPGQVDTMLEEATNAKS